MILTSKISWYDWSSLGIGENNSFVFVLVWGLPQGGLCPLVGFTNRIDLLCVGRLIRGSQKGITNKLCYFMITLCIIILSRYDFCVLNVKLYCHENLVSFIGKFTREKKDDGSSFRYSFPDVVRKDEVQYFLTWKTPILVL